MNLILQWKLRSLPQHQTFGQLLSTRTKVFKASWRVLRRKSTMWICIWKWVKNLFLHGRFYFHISSVVNIKDIYLISTPLVSKKIMLYFSAIMSPTLVYYIRGRGKWMSNPTHALGRRNCLCSRWNNKPSNSLVHKKWMCTQDWTGSC